jgi:hypothetical protein
MEGLGVPVEERAAAYFGTCLLGVFDIQEVVLPKIVTQCVYQSFVADAGVLAKSYVNDILKQLIAAMDPVAMFDNDLRKYIAVVLYFYRSGHKNCFGKVWIFGPVFPVDAVFSASIRATPH